MCINTLNAYVLVQTIGEISSKDIELFRTQTLPNMETAGTRHQIPDSCNQEVEGKVLAYIRQRSSLYNFFNGLNSVMNDYVETAINYRSGKFPPTSESTKSGHHIANHILKNLLSGIPVAGHSFGDLDSVIRAHVSVDINKALDNLLSIASSSSAVMKSIELVTREITLGLSDYIHQVDQATVTSSKWRNVMDRVLAPVPEDAFEKSGCEVGLTIIKSAMKGDLSLTEFTARDILASIGYSKQSVDTAIGHCRSAALQTFVESETNEKEANDQNDEVKMDGEAHEEVEVDIQEERDSGAVQQEQQSVNGSITGGNDDVDALVQPSEEVNATSPIEDESKWERKERSVGSVGVSETSKDADQEEFIPDTGSEIEGKPSGSDTKTIELADTAQYTCVEELNNEWKHENQKSGTNKVNEEYRSQQTEDCVTPGEQKVEETREANGETEGEATEANSAGDRRDQERSIDDASSHADVKIGHDTQESLAGTHEEEDTCHQEATCAKASEEAPLDIQKKLMELQKIVTEDVKQEVNELKSAFHGSRGFQKDNVSTESVIQGKEIQEPSSSEGHIITVSEIRCKLQQLEELVGKDIRKEINILREDIYSLKGVQGNGNYTSPTSSQHSQQTSGDSPGVSPQPPGFFQNNDAESTSELRGKLQSLEKIVSGSMQNQIETLKNEVYALRNTGGTALGSSGFSNTRSRLQESPGEEKAIMESLPEHQRYMVEAHHSNSQLSDRSEEFQSSVIEFADAVERVKKVIDRYYGRGKHKYSSFPSDYRIRTKGKVSIEKGLRAGEKENPTDVTGARVLAFFDIKEDLKHVPISTILEEFEDCL